LLFSFKSSIQKYQNKTIPQTYKHDNNNKYKNSHILEPHVIELLHTKVRAKHVKTNTKQSENKLKKLILHPKISLKPTLTINNYKTKKDYKYFTCQIENLLRPFKTY